MVAFKPDRTIAGTLLVLSIAQIISWGTISLPAIVSREMAADLHLSQPAVFAGTSVLYVVMGLCAPILAKPFTQLGARIVMSIGALAAAPGFILLATAQESIAYFAAWTILGAAGSAMLSTAAYIMLSEVAGANARSAIGALMLVTGLSYSVFWPITAVLADAIGWRATSLVFAAMMAACGPLYYFGLPRRAKPLPDADAAPASPSPPPRRAGIFALLVAVIALNGFVAFGLSAVFVELLRAVGLSATQAVAFGSTLGVIQVSARAVDFLGGAKWDGLTTALFAGGLLPVSMLILILGDGATWSVGAFILLYGFGSGALAVARATIPLVFYDQATFTRASSHIALPLNLMAALAPPVLAALLTQYGTNALIGVTLACSCAVLVMLVMLARRRAA